MLDELKKHVDVQKKLGSNDQKFIHDEQASKRLIAAANQHPTTAISRVATNGSSLNELKEIVS